MTDRLRGKIVIGARGSQLSLTQASWVIDKLREAWPDHHFELQVVKTSGDRDQNTSLSGMGGVGVFVKELERILSMREIDIAVHSAKDQPSNLASEFALAAVPKRAPVEDALISMSGAGLSELPPGAKIGTGSPRRRALASHQRPGLQFVDVRGNVDTRLQKLRDGEFDAIILAQAGLRRLGLEHHIVQLFSPDEFVPAPGQGALALEVRSGDEEITEIAGKIDCPQDHSALIAERSFISTLGAGCSTPVGAWARWVGGRLMMDAIALSPDGQVVVRSAGKVDTADEAEKLGRMLAQDLINQKAKEILISAF